jgi:hypothetical protein
MQVRRCMFLDDELPFAGSTSGASDGGTSRLGRRFEISSKPIGIQSQDASIWPRRR